MAEASKKAFKVPSAPTPEQISHAMRFIVGAIKAHLIERFYLFAEHRFITVDEVVNFADKEKHVFLGPWGEKGKYKDLGVGTQGWNKSMKVWCPVILDANPKKGHLNVVTTVQLLLGDIAKQAKKLAPELEGEAEKRIDKPFFMACIMIVLRHLNTIDDENFFRAAYLELKGLPADTHFVYTFMDEFVLPLTTTSVVNFDIITEQEARERHDVDCFKRLAKESKDLETKERTEVVKRRATEEKCVMYLELTNHMKRDSELSKITTHNFVLTNNWVAASEMRPKEGTILKQLIVNHTFRDNIVLPLDSDNKDSIPRIVVSAEDVGSNVSSSKKETKKTEKKDIEMPPVAESATMEAERRFEEDQKNRWAEDTSIAMVEQLMKYVATPQGRAKVLKSLNVAAGLLSEKTKRGGDHFNLDTTRLLLGDNNNRGIVTGAVDGAPLFKGRNVLLAVNVKSKTTPIKWFKESKVGTNTNLTSNNSDLTAWVRDKLMPRVWKLFASSFVGEGTSFAQTADEEIDEDERVDGVTNGDTEGDNDENAEPEDLIFSKRNVKEEMAFISAHTANLPMMPDEVDLTKLGGDLASQRAQQFKVNITAMNLDPKELERLKVVRKTLSDFYKPDTQSVIAAIKRNIKVVPSVPVSVNGKPFEMMEPEEAEEAQFTADYRSNIASKFESEEFQEEEEQEEE